MRPIHGSGRTDRARATGPVVAAITPLIASAQSTAKARYPPWYIQ